MIFVDSNVLIDVFDGDDTWSSWSHDQLRNSVRRDQCAVTQVVLAEIAPRFETVQEFYEALGDFGMSVQSLSDEGAFVAGKAFREYRRLREGPKSILADFLIGGQASVAGATILTRDPAIYARYFPDVSLITPDKELK